ncbi:MAG: outer membrane beta-barrel protein [Candidatus Omnitrophica bacterium]|nr:outer membrane beta-barrel protein [Candidatus Omnitrophota bacterium]
MKKILKISIIGFLITATLAISSITFAAETKTSRIRIPKSFLKEERSIVFKRADYDPGGIFLRRLPREDDIDNFNIIVDVRERYNDNIFYTQNERIYDFITNVKPSFDFLWDAKRYEIRGGCNADLELFQVYDSRNNLDYGAHLSTHLLKGNKLNFKLSDKIRNRESPTGEIFSSDIQRWYENDLVFETFYDPRPKISSKLTISHFIKGYKSLSATKQYGHRIFDIEPTIYYQISPRITLISQFITKYIKYSEGLNRNSWSQMPGGGIRVEITKKANIDVRANYLYRSYYDVDTIDRVNDFTLDAKLTYNFSKNISLKLRAQRDIYESTRDEIGNAHLISSSFIPELNIGRFLFPNLELNLSGKAERSVYPAKITEESKTSYLKINNFYCLTKLKYRLTEAIGIGLDYSWSMRDSRYSGLDYFKNEITLKAKYVY